jgi:hypothetical protein
MFGVEWLGKRICVLKRTGVGPSIGSNTNGISITQPVPLSDAGSPAAAYD